MSLKNKHDKLRDEIWARHALLEAAKREFKAASQLLIHGIRAFEIESRYAGVAIERLEADTRNVTEVYAAEALARAEQKLSEAKAKKVKREEPKSWENQPY